MNHYFEKLKEQNDLSVDNGVSVEPQYPIVDGIVWPPRSLEDVKSNCSIWCEFGFFDPEELPTVNTQQKQQHKTLDTSNIQSILKSIRN